MQAGEILDGAVTTDLDSALAPANWIVGTSNAPAPGCRVMTPREVAEQTRTRGAPTLLFGGEINGLDPAEMLRCHAVAVIPTAPEQSSLNLAQAVCVFAAELYAACGEMQPPPQAERAPADLVQRVEQALTTLLESSDWAKANRPKNSIATLMQPLYRADLTEKEVHAWLVALGKLLPR